MHRCLVLLWTAGTMEFCRCRNRNLPCASTATTSNLPSSRDGDGPTLYLEGFPVQESVGDGLVRALENPSKRWPRDIHLCRRMLVLVPLEVGKPECLQLIQREDDQAEAGHRYALGLEQADFWRSADEALFVWSCHSAIMSVCL